MKDENWRLEQASTIGGSSAAAVLGQARWMTPSKLWHKMRAAVVEKRAPAPAAMNDDMRRGIEREPDAIRKLGETLNVPIRRHDQNEFIYNPKYPWAHALPDGWFWNHALAEVKVPRPATVMRCNLEGLLADWRIQALHNMAVCSNGRRVAMCAVGLLDPMSEILHFFQVEYDQAFINELMCAEQAFYQSVLDNHPPEQDVADSHEPESDRRDVLQLFDADSEQLAETWFRLKAIETDLQEAFAAARKRFEVKLGTAQAAEVTGLARIWWQQRATSRHLDKSVVLQKYPQIESDEACWTTTAPSRPFRVIPLKRKDDQ